MVDAGGTLKYLAGTLSALGYSFADLSAILLSHEHTDHLGVAVPLSRLHRIPLWVTLEMAECVSALREAELRLIPVGEYFAVGDLDIHSFRTPHDSLAAVGFSFYKDKQKIAVATDMGVVTDEIMAALSLADVCVIEANHDLAMLRASRYPLRLKKRIAGPLGHLSNIDAAAAISKLATGREQTFVLAHLSSDCNTPEMALATVTAALANVGADDIRLMHAPRMRMGSTCGVLS